MICIVSSILWPVPRGILFFLYDDKEKSLWKIEPLTIICDVYPNVAEKHPTWRKANNGLLAFCSSFSYRLKWFIILAGIFLFFHSWKCGAPRMAFEFGSHFRSMHSEFAPFIPLGCLLRWLKVKIICLELSDKSQLPASLVDGLPLYFQESSLDLKIWPHRIAIFDQYWGPYIKYVHT